MQKINSYGDLPSHKLIDFQGKRSVIEVHTGVCFHKLTEKWCMVQPHHTPPFGYIIHAGYNKYSLKRLLLSLTRDEFNTFESIINNRNHQEYIDLYLETFGEAPQDLFPFYLLLDFESVFESFKFRIDQLNLEPPYIFPKGRSNKYEESKQATLRELKEETGLSLPQDIIDEAQYQQVNMAGYSNREYINNIWRFELDSEELPQLQIEDIMEIKKVDWIYFPELKRPKYQNYLTGIDSDGKEIIIDKISESIII